MQELDKKEQTSLEPSSYIESEYVIPDLEEGVIVSDGGEIVLPEEFDFYGSDLGKTHRRDWFAEEEERRETVYDQIIKFTPSEFTEASVKMAIEGKPIPFSFEGREYLRVAYDIQAPRVLLMCGRQVEKCCEISSLVSMADGTLKAAGDIKVGDSILSIDPASYQSAPARVTWVSQRKKKKGVKIRTRQGHEVQVGHEHPMRVWGGWKKSEELVCGERLAVLRRGGEFSTTPHPRSDRSIELCAYFIGDGSTRGSARSITGSTGCDVLARCEDIANQEDLILRIRHRTETTTTIHFKKQIDSYLFPDLLGKLSGDRFLPSWVFQLDKRQTALFLNSLWATDGHCKQNTKSKWSLEYCSTSHTLIRQIQALLWKFGIPSKIRENWPSYWKRQDVEKKAYILRIETLSGVRTFLTDIGALGKTEGMTLPPAEVKESNNRDTIPIEVNDLIKRINKSRPGKINYGNSLRTRGLRETLKYAPTKAKLKKYVEFFRRGDYNQKLVDELARHTTDPDIFWDEIESIEEVPELECVDFTVTPHHTFIADGFVTHNSTLIGNSILSRMCITPHFRALYVSSSHEQTKVFRRDRIGEPIALSEIIQAYISPKHANNMSILKFVNFSQLVLRYAYLSADRVRGIPADGIYIDEIQDILTDNIAVIEECAFHADPLLKMFVYSGTPKSYDNTINKIWEKRSTQNEYALPCDCTTIHSVAPGDANKRSTKFFWNVPLEERHMGLKSLICTKCGKPISSKHPQAQWVSMNADIRKHQLIEPFEGFRIPQIMVPWVEWGDILNKRESYSRAKFYNEVLAMPYDSGNRPLKMGDLMRNSICMLPANDIEALARATKNTPLFFGIDWGCHDEETRILTTEGFKYFRDLTLGDKVAQVDKETNEMTFTFPTHITDKPWEGELLHFKNKNQDLMVTPDHRMLVRGSNSSSWVVEDARNTISRGTHVKFKGRIHWEGTEQEEFIIPGLPTSTGYKGADPQTLPMDLWLKFLGYYLSEGGLCFSKGRPSCIKMSQRVSANPETAARMKEVLYQLPWNVSEFPNPKTTDINWTIYGKQLWQWICENIGRKGYTKRIPRQFLQLSPAQLRILWSAMMEGDGNYDTREGNYNGSYCSTSKQLAEDFQEICVRLGLRASVRRSEKGGNRRTQWIVSWSRGRDLHFTLPAKNVRRVPYEGRVYCCTVPKGFIVTERKGKVSIQGNSGENSYTVLTIGGYLGENKNRFSLIYFRRFTGPEIDPTQQIRKIRELVNLFQPLLIGTDYGGGFDRNSKLVNAFGARRIAKYQYIGGTKSSSSSKRAKVQWDTKKGRYLLDRTEVMSDMFSAIKDDKLAFPQWKYWNEPYGTDMLSIFSEYNDVLKTVQYNKSIDATDDSFHSALYCFFVSMIKYPRIDVLRPSRS